MSLIPEQQEIAEIIEKANHTIIICKRLISLEMEKSAPSVVKMSKLNTAMAQMELIIKDFS